MTGSEKKRWGGRGGDREGEEVMRKEEEVRREEEVTGREKR